MYKLKINLNIISNRTIRPIDEVLTGSTTPSQSVPESNDNKGVILYSPEVEPHLQCHVLLHKFI